MSLLAKIRSDLTLARREASSTRSALSTLLGEIELKAKRFSPAREITDAEIVAIVKSFVENGRIATQALRSLTGDRARPVDLATAEAEIGLYETYLPSQMGEDEIEAYVVVKKAAGMNLGQIMGALKADHAGGYDGRLASEVVKRVLSV